MPVTASLAHRCVPREDGLATDVLIPEGRVLLDKGPEQRRRLWVIELDDLDLMLGQPVMAAREVRRLTDHDGADVELTNQAGAIPAGGEGGHHHAVGVVATASGIAECIGLGMERGVIKLDATVVSTTQQCPVTMEEGGADRDPSLRAALARLLERHAEHPLRVGPGDRWPLTCHRCPLSSSEGS